MKKSLSFIFLSVVFVGALNAQKHHKDSSTLKISGSADIYYKYDFAQSQTNIPSQDILGTKQNSLDFGVFDLKIQKGYGKATFFTDLAFGPRPDVKPVDPQNSYHLQNLYISYQLNKKLSFAAGAMYKYQSFEKITPVDNFNYSMSKSWEQNFLTNPRAAGVKATYIFSDKVSLTAGFYNTIDPKAPADNVSSTPSYGVSDFVTQLFVNPTKDLQLSAAYWREAQTVNGSHTNFQARYQLNKRLKLGLDFTRYKADTLAAVNSYTSAVLYAQEKLNNVFTIGGRYEYMDKTEAPNGINTFTYLPGYYSILTLTLNEKLGPIALKEEVKFDQTNKGNLNTVYLDKDAKPTDKATQLVIAAVFSF